MAIPIPTGFTLRPADERTDVGQNATERPPGATRVPRGHLNSTDRACRYRNKSPRASNVRSRRAEAAAKPVAGPWTPDVDVPYSELLPYIKCCHHNERRPQSYWLWTWEANDPTKRTRAPYRCGSWRCPFGCRSFAGHLLYARIVESFEGLDPADLVMVVLTLPSVEHFRAGYDLAAVYRDVLERKEKLWKRLRRFHDSRGWQWIGSKYVAVLEQHRSGVPHVNLLVHSPDWARQLRAEKPKDWVFEAELRFVAESAGWGWRCTAEPIRGDNVEALAGYIVKLAGRTDSMHGELSKACQLPVKAPRHFRRLRSGKGFLSPKRKREGYTGTIVRRKWTEHGDEMVLPLVLGGNEAYKARVRECCEAEWQLAQADAERRSRDVELKKMGIRPPAWGSDVSTHYFRASQARGVSPPPEPQAQPPPEAEQQRLFPGFRRQSMPSR